MSMDNMDMDMDMGGDMSSSNSSSSSMSGMMMTMSMTFFNARDTPLYSTAWAPGSAGAYAGTLIFLMVLGVVLRLLVAGKTLAEARWLDAEMRRRYVVVQGRQPMAERVSDEGASHHSKMVLSENGVEEDVVVVQKKGDPVRPWRLSVDPLRALVDTCIAGVSYLLMLAVMTMNIGYFLAVLAGTFLGSLLVGRFASTIEH
ncbi:Ctr copper transporter family-domain-containing protein [Xylariomycetidae sp. FL0641]|nr:Ctr copper transporter family-domain-containing protein [Xylariomycetidae sp. FL0641]